MKGILFNKDIQIEPQVLPDGITGFVLGDIAYQNQYSILTTFPGEHKHSLKTGIGIAAFLDDDSPEVLFRKIRTQFASDSLTVKRMGFNEKGNLEIEAAYND